MNRRLSPNGEKLARPLRFGVPCPVVQVDGFHAHPDAFREELVRQEYADRLGPDGQTYKRIGLRPEGDLAGYLEGVTGGRVRQKYSLARLNYAGELPNNVVHSDAGYDQLAAVLYLSRPADCRGGTAFWRHRESGWEFLPSVEQAVELGQDPEAVMAGFVRDWNDASAWELVRHVSMVCNRAVIYPTRAFHSRFPFAAFGTTPEDGRLIWTSFFDLA